MKIRKRSILQRTMAYLLSAALIAGMVSNAVPVRVLAQESGEEQESADRNMQKSVKMKTPGAGEEEPGAGVTEPGAGEVKPEAGVTEPGAGEVKPEAGVTEPGAGEEESETDGTKPGAGEDKSGLPAEQIQDGKTVPESTEENEALEQDILDAVSQAGKRDIHLAFKIYGYNAAYPVDLTNVGVIWAENKTEPVLAEAVTDGEDRGDYTLWEFLFRDLDEGRKYAVVGGDAKTQIYEFGENGTEFERILYAIHSYDGNELINVVYLDPGQKLPLQMAGTPEAREGFSFAGWVTENGGSELFDFENTEITQVTNLYASWKQTAPSGITDFGQLQEAVAKGGTVVLTQDITLTGSLRVDKDVTIISEGSHTIRRGSDFTGSMFTVSGGSLTLGDGVGTLILDGGAVWTGTADATLNRGMINSGITASSSIIYGTGGNSVIRLKGNTVLQNNCCGEKGYGGAVTLENSGLIIEGARICDNKSRDGGGAVKTFSGSSLVMTGGEICQNEAGTHGGAFQIYSGERGSASIYSRVSCTVSGGSIRNNLASGVGGAIAVSDHSALELSGTAVVYRNKTTDSSKRGGGVGFIDQDTSLTVAGQVQIRENLCGNAANNLALGVKDNRITVGQLEDVAEIGITSITSPVQNTPVEITGENGADCSGYFRSDNPDYVITDGAGHRVQLSVPDKHTHSLIKHDAVLAECLKDGTGEYWKCEGTDGCGKMFSDAAGSHEIGQIPILPKTGHSPDKDDWHKDVERHWHVCAKCGARTEEENHTYSAGAPVCTVCGYDKAVSDTVPPSGTIKMADKSWTGFLENITFDLFYKEAVQVTIAAQDDGAGVDKICYYISGVAFSQAEVEALGEAVWTEGSSFSISPDRYCVIYVKLTDKAGNTDYLSSNGLVFDATAPVIGGVTDKGTYPAPQEVTVTDANLKSVTVNGTAVALVNNKFTLKASDDPQTITAADKAGNTATVTVTVKEKPVGDGKLEQDVNREDKAPVTQISTPVQTLADIILTPEEKKQLESGTDIKIILDVKDAKDSVAREDKALVEETLNLDAAVKGFVVGQYLDISLFKLIGTSRSAISETDRKIAVTLHVPDGLKNRDGRQIRTFAVIRVHDGRAEVLPDVDDSADTITIETDRFSTYVIVYNDTTESGGKDDDGSGGSAPGNNGGNAGTGGNATEKNNENNNGNNNGNKNNSAARQNGSGSATDNNGAATESVRDKEPKTGDERPLELYATLAMIAGLSYLLLYFADRRRGMTEETKKELVSRLVAWAKRGGRMRKRFTLAIIFVLLVYYHSIGKKTAVEWKEIYGE